MCNAPKFTEVEERTGLGGGFNERGIVEYKERVESDDEFDDFGRRKKKKGDNTYRPVESSIKADAPNNYVVEEEVEEEEEEEEDEDDEDDGDLSKYDLWGNDDDEGSAKAKTDDKSNGKTDVKASSDKDNSNGNGKKVDKREKSRSRSPSRSKKKSRRSRR